MTYPDAVKKNLDDMGTPASQWRALPIKGIYDNGEGKAFKTFDFPEGFSQAPTLYRSSEASPCCELCAHPIQNAYWIANDTKGWIMLVGSECVTHFQEQSGQEMTKAFKQAQARETIEKWVNLRNALYADFSYKGDLGYGRHTRRWRMDAANAAHAALKACQGQTTPDSSQAAITRFHNKHADTLTAIQEAWEQRNATRLWDIVHNKGIPPTPGATNIDPPF